ncbi:MAG TPA: alpha/beta hydrolase [Baekduia sp.]|uniref:alpha/beta hydrolase n=1 Tax=Baekduia sp. TaxID=2600305 RepID=UPI002D77C656|nr:alpha/beta hydrolase [Baekduia sp.]HET6509069.1 alpha/beta hydrolase [Baekduia sp.]
MSSVENEGVHRLNNELRDAWQAQAVPGYPETRRIFDEWLAQLAVPETARFSPGYAGRVPVLHVGTPESEGSSRTVLHFHSGGYLMGSAHGYRSFGGYLSAHTRSRVVLPDYRLAPENPFPAAIEDGLEVYTRLLEEGRAADSIVLSGDSAGGGLVCVLVQWIRDHGLPLPAGVVSLSPVADYTHSGASRTENDGKDPLVLRDLLLGMGADYFGDRDPRAPGLSPVFGNWAGLPPMRFYAGSIEVLRDDAKLCAEAAAAAGVDATYTEGEDMAHIWTLFADRLPEARATLDEIGDFVERVCA